MTLMMSFLLKQYLAPSPVLDRNLQAPKLHPARIPAPGQSELLNKSAWRDCQ